MARPTAVACERDNLIESCYRRLTLHERRAFMVYLMVQELAALGGTDYTSELGPSDTLNTAAEAYGTLNLSERDVAELVIQAGNTTASGGTTPATADIPTAIACLKNFDVDTLNRMRLYLLCQLGRHAAYPQVDL